MLGTQNKKSAFQQGFSMLEINFTPFPTLTTKRLILRKFKTSDVKEIFFLRSDDTVNKYLDRAKIKDLAEAQDWLSKALNTLKKNEGIDWAITLKNEDKMVGIISYWRLMKEHYRAEIGYSLHPDLFKRGIMSEAMQAVISYAFKETKLHSIEANVNPFNEGSIGVLLKNGFVKEGHFKENYYWNGKFIDSAYYSLVKKD